MSTFTAKEVIKSAKITMKTLQIVIQAIQHGAYIQNGCDMPANWAYPMPVDGDFIMEEELGKAVYTLYMPGWNIRDTYK